MNSSDISAADPYLRRRVPVDGSAVLERVSAGAKDRERVREVDDEQRHDRRDHGGHYRVGIRLVGRLRAHVSGRQVRPEDEDDERCGDRRQHEPEHEDPTQVGRCAGLFGRHRAHATTFR